MDKYYFYVLQCNDGTFYGGYTVDLERRLTMHNAKKGAKYTRSRTPVTLIYYQIFETKREALRAEYEFKKLTRKKKEEFLKKERLKREYTKEL
ncbi:GIY-YIG nuclease family protein [Fervidibacillus halotolerans]|uniref:GIY-YIG nuclease family protein n=1 Tax=Fervidibacillus halotolerans TaxID=2980027 RepID=A0A9E8LYV7_9BACI|nr:GIY-YIG nuclease family protein [Fervidibacillus halotolerans]WAA12328.1 GIY-YIG nuclease family protein [Fervidibacillus halotolerans]